MGAGGSGDTGKLFFSMTYDFLEAYLPRQVGRSPETVRSYRDALTVFRRHVNERLGKRISQFTFADCDRDCVLGFVERMREEGLSCGTCNQRVAAIRCYLWYAADVDVALTSVALSVSRIPPLKGPQRLRETLSEDALKAIFSMPDPTSKKGVRDLAIMVLLYDSGIRLSELLGLAVGDATLEGGNPHVFVTGKGDKERVVPICEKTAAHIARHVSMSHGPAPRLDAPLFFTRIRGETRKMSPSNVERIVQKYADAARETCPDIPSHVYPHMYRRSRATDLYQQGVELALVSRILGHASLETTKVYARPSMEMMREAMSHGVDADDAEAPIWENDEELMARLCGIR